MCLLTLACTRDLASDSLLPFPASDSLLPVSASIPASRAWWLCLLLPRGCQWTKDGVLGGGLTGYVNPIVNNTSVTHLPPGVREL